MKTWEKLYQIEKQMRKLEDEALQLVRDFGNEEILKEAYNDWYHEIWMALGCQYVRCGFTTLATTVSRIGSIEKERLK